MEFLSKSGLSFFKSLLDLYFATKSYVNKAISTNTGKFWGTYNSLADLQEITGSNGDYAYVIVPDDYSTSYDRYKWQDNQWVYEYTVGGESFDDDQWAAINSGITASDKARLNEISNNIGNNSISEMRSDIDAEKVHADSLIFDVTKENSGTTFASLSALLSSPNLSTLIPTNVRTGGMTIRFVLTSDNNYVQYRYMETDATTAATFANVANWQGVDENPKSGSHNLVESGGVASEISGTRQKLSQNELVVLGEREDSYDISGYNQKFGNYKFDEGTTYTIVIDASISGTLYFAIKDNIGETIEPTIGITSFPYTLTFTPQDNYDGAQLEFGYESPCVVTASVSCNESLRNDINNNTDSIETVSAQTEQLVTEIYGKNDFNYQSGKALGNDDVIYDDADWGVSEYVPYESGTGITWNYGQKKVNHNLLFYNSDKEYITGAYWAATSDSGQTSIAASSIQQYAPNAAFIRASFLLSNTQAGLSSGGNVIWSPQNIHQNGIKEGVTNNTAYISSLYNILETLIQLNSSMDVRRYLIDNAPYYFDIPNNLSSYDEDNYLDQRIKETPIERQFLFFTDTHQQNTSNCKISSVIEYVKNRLAIPLSVFGGDAIEIYNGDDANYKALANVGNLASEYCSAGGGGFLWVEGNHDANSPGHSDSTIANNYLINDFEEYLRTTRNMPASVHFYDDALEYSSLFLTDIDIASFITSFEADGGIFEADSYSGPTFNGQYVQQLFVGWCKKNYYFDDTKNRIRYLVLDTRDGSIFSRMTKYTNSYILADFIESTLKSVPEGYDLVVLGHQWGNDNNNSPLFSSGDGNLCNLVYQMLLAYKSKGSFTFSPYLYQNYYLGAKWWKAKYGNAGSKTYTFSECKANKIVVLGGHYHFDCAWKVYHSSGTTLAADEIDNGTTIASDEILVVWTHRATYGASPYDPVQQVGLQYARSYSMTNGTISEYAFDVATLLSDRIHFTRYGAGVDREYVFQS